MASNRSIKLLLVFVLSLVLIACSVFNSGKKIEELQGTIEAMSTQVGQAGIKEGENPTQPVSGIVGGEVTEENTEAPGAGSGLELIGQYGGSAATVAVSGNYAYMGQGPRLVILDVSNPSKSEFISQGNVLPGIVLGVEVVDQFVYATTRYGGIYIYDIRDPLNPILLGSAQPENPGCGALTLGENIAYVACNPSGLFIVDVKDPVNPSILSSGELPGAVISIAKYRDHVYLADQAGKELTIVDVANPANPNLVGAFNVEKIPSNYDKIISAVSVCEDNLCMAVANYGLAILDLADPEDPMLLGGNSPFWASGIVTLDQYAYLLSDPDGLLVFDISDPGAPKKVGSVITGMGGELEFSVQELIERGMYISEDRLYITDQRDGLIIIDIGDPSSPQLAGVYTTPVSDWLMDIKVRDQFAYVVSRSAGFRVLDVSEPGNLKEIFYDDERKNLYLQVPTALELVENFAFISDANYPFHVYEISNPGMPTQVSTLYDATASDGAKDMVISGSYAYLSGWGGKDAFFPGNGIWVVDISNPAALEAVNFVDLPNKDWSLAIREKTLFAFDGSIDQDQAEPFSLRVLDISNGASPAVIRTIPVPQMQMMSPSDIVAAGDELYLSAGMMGLVRYDITDPQNPVESPVDRSLFPYAFQLHAALPYLVVNGNQVWDVSQPDSPELIGYAMEALEAWNSDIEDDLLFIATKMHGVYVYRIK